VTDEAKRGAQMTHRERAEAFLIDYVFSGRISRADVLTAEFAAVELSALERAAKECDAASPVPNGREFARRIRALAKGGGT
jgi:hypothetical protein